MKISLFHKLGASILAFCIVGLAMLWVSMQFLFQHTFLDYINEQAEVSLADAAGRLATFYGEAGSWQPLRGNHRLWIRLTSGQSLEFPVSGRRGMEPPPRPEGRVNSRGLLLDSNGRPVMGFREIMTRDDVLRVAVEVKGDVVGYLLAPSRRHITAELDRNFAASLNRSVLLVLAFGVVFSLIVSALLARNISRPVTRLSAATSDLREGKYTTRINLDRSDELGRLAADFNRLAVVLEANRHSQQRWVADISHELRTPLAIIQGELQALEDGVRDFDERSLKSLSTEVERFSRLVNDLYDLSRAEAGDLSYRLETLSVSEVLEQAVEAFQARYNEKGIKLDLDPVDKQQTVKADPTRFTQLLTNLLENSLRYTDAPGRTLIRCSTNSKREIEITVDDSSPGVPDAAIGHIFDRLYRVEASRSTLHGGGGLGLSICKAIVEAHGGNINAAHSTLGGLGICIRLPDGSSV